MDLGSAFAWWGAFKLTERQLRQEAEHRKYSHYQRFAPLIARAIRENLPQLTRKHQELVFTDDYGVTRYDDWFDELEYFLRGTVPDMFDGFDWNIAAIDAEFRQLASAWLDSLTDEEAKNQFGRQLTASEIVDILIEAYSRNGWRLTPLSLHSRHGIYVLSEHVASDLSEIMLVSDSESVRSDVIDEVLLVADKFAVDTISIRCSGSFDEGIERLAQELAIELHRYG
jgi:hypothetical protein